MNVYADYDFYKDEYKGLLEESLFDSYSVEATLIIRNATQNKATSNVEEVKLCMCKLVDTMNKNSKLNSEISSEKVDDYSRTFVNRTQTDINKEYYNIVSQYLGILGLLHGGVSVVY